MASYLVQAGATLYRVSPTGAWTTLTMPSGASVINQSNARTRAAMIDDKLVIVNGVTNDIYVTPDNTCRLLAVTPPATPVTLAAGAITGAGNMTGLFDVRTTFKVKAADGSLISETAPGPTGPSISLSATPLKVTNIPVSSDSSVNARGLYRTETSGTIYRAWLDLDGNTETSVDATITTTASGALPTAPVRSGLGAAVRLKLIVAWKERLWGVPKDTPDRVRFTEERSFYGWPDTYEIVVPPMNTDVEGVTAFIPRRDQLGIARKDRSYQVMGDGLESFQRLELSSFAGCVSQESVVVIDNVAYWLGQNGVYEWSDNGVHLVSSQQVDAWFTAGTFTRTSFPLARGWYNADTHAYELALVPAGGEAMTQWISYHIRERRWYGPHTSSIFTISAPATNGALNGYVNNASGVKTSLVGMSAGTLAYRASTDSTYKDYTATGSGSIAMQIDMPFLHDGQPDMIKVWGAPTIHTKPGVTTGTLSLIPTVGKQNAQTGPTLTHDLTLSREMLSRLGVGEMVKLVLTCSTGSGCRIQGLELPYEIRGQR